MEQFGKLLLLVLAGCMAGLFLRDSPFRAAASAIALLLGGLLLLSVLQPVTELIRELIEAAGVEAAVFAPVLRAAAIGLLTQAASGFCADAGEHALQKLMELSGILCILYVSLPLFTAVLSMLQRLMEG